MGLLRPARNPTLPGISIFPERKPEDLSIAILYSNIRFVSRVGHSALIGEQISHYQIIEELGRGGMGVVYLAEDLDLKRKVALKFLPVERTSDEEARTRFVQEAQAASALDHPNIGTIYEIGRTDEGQAFIAMAYYEGRTLEQMLADMPEGSGLPVEEALDFARQIARGLERAHEAGIIHRDIKPDNIIITERGEVKIIDFGLAKLSDSTQITRTGSTLGTVAYMSPEQVQSQPVDHRTDIWSLGVVLYEMLSGNRPFEGDYDAAICFNIVSVEPMPLPEHGIQVPYDVQALVDNLLAKDVELRPQSVTQALGHLHGGGTPSHSARRRGSSKRSPRVMIFALAFLIFAAAATAFYYYHDPDNDSTPGPKEPPKRTLFTSHRGVEAVPSFSPDGNEIAYGGLGLDVQDNIDIYIKQIGIGAYKPFRLTNHSDPDVAAAWSPDGRYIALYRENRQKEEYGIYLVPSLGGGERKLTSLHGPSVVSWSPDGGSVVFVDGDSVRGSPAVYSLSIGTLERRRLTEQPGPWPTSDIEARISPDGKMLAFVRGEISGFPYLLCLQGTPYNWFSDIFVMSLADSSVRQLTFDKSSIVGLAWTRDSHEIIYASDRIAGYGSHRLWRIPASGGESVQIPTRGDRDIYPAVSPDGGRLAYMECIWPRNSIWHHKLPGSAVASVEPSQLIYSSNQVASAEYSPDGSHIVFASRHTGNDEIWVCDSDGSNPVQLTFFDGPRTGTPRWSPDGRFIAFDSFGSLPGIYVIAADGGGPRQITLDSLFAAAPFWSADGRWIFSFHRPGIQKTHISGKSTILVIPDGRAPHVSPDGKWLYFWKGPFRNGSIWKMPVDGGNEKLIMQDCHFNDWGAWVAFDDGIYFLTSEAERTMLMFFDLEAREARKIMDITPSGSYLHISADRKHLLASRFQEGRYDIVLLENWR